MAINNVYFPTWVDDLDWDKGAGMSRLAKVPSYITHITLSFLRPDGEYSGLDTKMDKLFYDGEIELSQLKREISISRTNGGEGRCILASAGGEIGGNFHSVNYDGLTEAIDELGLDGLDIDYEPDGGMTSSDEQIAKYIEVICGFRKAFDRKSSQTGKRYILSCAPTGIGLLGRTDLFNRTDLMDSDFGSFDIENQEEFNKCCSVIAQRLKDIVPQPEHEEELKIGRLGDSCELRQPRYKVGTAASCYDFPSAGKMIPVFLTENRDKSLGQYRYVGQMVDIVFFQAYNMGTGNVLGKILCYESHRTLSDFFDEIKKDSGFALGHGSHVGMEAWPRFSYTRKRLTYIYRYIRDFGRECDGASFWSYFSPYTDKTENVPGYGMDFSSTEEVFEHTGTVLGLCR